MAPAQIEWLAVLIGTVAYGSLGFLWYSPFGLGKLWLHAMGWKDRSQVPDLTYYVGWGTLFLAGFSASVGLSILLDWTAAASLVDGALVGLVVALAVVLPIGAISIGWEERPILAYLLAAPLHLLGLTGLGVLLIYLGGPPAPAGG